MSESFRPAISVLVPVYNVEKYLGRCLDSVLSQSFGDFEIICVNDCSPDGSVDILNEYSRKDKRIKIVNKSRNEGLMMARRTGIEYAAGRYLFFLDSDDYLPPYALSELHEAAQRSGAQIAIGDIATVNQEGRQVRKNRPQKAGATWHSYMRSVLHWNIPSLCGSLFSRELFEDRSYTAILHQSHSEDRILLTELLLTTHPSIVCVDKVTYYYWLNTGSITRAVPDDAYISSQFGALFYCYDYVNSHAPELRADNNNFIIRYLGLFIEKGCRMEQFCRVSDKASGLLSFSEMNQYAGLRFAAHTWMCINIPGYRPLTHGLRQIIRKIQGKD